MIAAAMLLDALKIPDDYPLPTLSYSSLAEMDRCPLRWKYRYLDGRDSANAPWLALGWHTHKAIELYYAGVEEPLETAERMLKDSWEWSAGLDKAIMQMRRMFNAYASAYVPAAEISEQRYEARVGGTTAVCIVDLIEDAVLVDYKSHGKDFTPDPLQLAFSAAVLEANDVKVEKAEIRALRKDVKGGRVAILSVHEFDLTPEFIAEQLAIASERVEEICLRIRTDLWVGPPADESGIKKSCIFGCTVTDCAWKNS